MVIYTRGIATATRGPSSASKTNNYIYSLAEMLIKRNIRRNWSVVSGLDVSRDFYSEVSHQQDVMCLKLGLMAFLKANEWNGCYD